MWLFALLVVVGPALLLATVVVELVSRGPLGIVEAVALLAAVALFCRQLSRWTWRWWRGTRAPVQVRQTPAELRRLPRT